MRGGARRYRGKVSAALERQGRKQSWFIREMAISQSLFYAIERGERNATPDYRRRASKLLGLPQRDLFEVAS